MQTLTVNAVTGRQETEDDVVIETTTPVTVVLNHVRSFNSRKGGNLGTRITFVNGSGIAVTDSVETIAEAVRNA